MPPNGGEYAAYVRDSEAESTARRKGKEWFMLWMHEIEGPDAIDRDQDAMSRACDRVSSRSPRASRVRAAALCSSFASLHHLGHNPLPCSHPHLRARRKHIRLLRYASTMATNLAQDGPFDIYATFKEFLQDDQVCISRALARPRSGGLLP